MLRIFALPLTLQGSPVSWPMATPNSGQLTRNSVLVAFRTAPECTPSGRTSIMEEASFDLECASPRDRGESDAIRIACVGDSITAGVHSTGGNHAYRSTADAAGQPIRVGPVHGYQPRCMRLRLRLGDSPYWERPQFQALVSGEWDVVTIMLGTNDARTVALCIKTQHNESDWQHDCGGVDTTVKGCTFAEDFAAMVRVARARTWRPAKVWR